jgi:probable phosphoglycerate mutase
MPTALNAVGRWQAARLAERLERFTPRIEALLSSDLPRATETAAPIAGALGLEVHVDSSWRERSFGPFEGKRVGEADLWRTATGSIDVPGVESADAFHARIARAITSVVGRFPGQTCVAVVTHGGPIRAVINLLRAGRLPLAADQTAPDLVPIENCSIMHLLVSPPSGDAVWRVRCVNGTEHLRGGAPPADGAVELRGDPRT